MDPTDQLLDDTASHFADSDQSATVEVHFTDSNQSATDEDAGAEKEEEKPREERWVRELVRWRRGRTPLSAFSVRMRVLLR